MVGYIRSDLEFILKQIKIAEDHALYLRTNGAQGKPLFGGPNASIPSYNIAWGLRTVDGSYNHLLAGQEDWGSSDQPFKELVAPQYRTVTVRMDPDGPGPAPEMDIQIPYTPGNDVDGPGTFADPGDVIDPTVRTASNLIVDQTLSNPAAIITSLTRNEVAGNLLEIAAEIKAAYELIDHLFKAVDDALDAYSEAQAAAEANPGDAGLQTAAVQALTNYQNAQGDLTAARGPLDALLIQNGVEIDGANVVLPNVAPDEGLSAPFNSWFTLFGQFFDHGLDLVNKGGSGAVMIPLQPDDPLWSDEPGALNFMALTRATTSPGNDGVYGTDDDVRPVNTTTPFVDQNQTYTSHPSHQVFLRQYELTANRPTATGHLIEGSNGGMANWGEVKAQTADILGFQLLDQDVGRVPLLLTDPYGNFIPGANGFPQAVTAVDANGNPTAWVEGDPDANGGLGVSLEGTVRTNMAFLADIAHNAVPNGLADGDIEIGLDNGGESTDGTYDNELLDRHFIAGDGRANENIGLTAVHHVFHSEHNRLAEHTKETVVADAQAMFVNGSTQAQAVAFLNEWLAVDVATVPTTGAQIEALVWDGNRIFQAAKFGTEMQYQHLVFEEFARKIQPSINPFLVPDGFDTTLDPTIFAEFAHTVYRFGHSMLNESIDRFDASFNDDHIGLIQGFLNPIEFDANGTQLDGISAGDIIRGMTRQTGNHIDEFVTSALRNNLLGLPLDLATINLARGRDTGVPTLQAARETFYDATDQNVLLKPYDSWVDFAANLKNEASIINFIAAYGTHPLITGQTTIEGKRDAALTIITGVSVGGFTVPADSEAFLNGTGAYATGLGGLNDVDLWIGGLAEKTMPFGGMLGSTFEFVFEQQMENLQSGDRFYYLQRLDGLHLFGEMEANSFASIIMRNTNATHLPSDVFADPGLILEVDITRQYNDLDGDGVLEHAVDPLGSGLLTKLVVRDNPETVGPDGNYLKYNGGEHVVLGGTDGTDHLTGGIGDDTLHGDGGRDYLNGGHGNDIINGGAGDDIIRDLGGDDNIKGGDGNDAIHGGPGLDLVLAGAGKDFVVLGTDAGGEVFGGTGDDFILGNKNAERILGNEGNDWLETGTFDGAPGDNFDEIFANDGIDGHDVFLGDGGFDEFIGEGGDDIMVGSPGRGKMAGMSGFDWATYKASSAGVTADLSLPIVFDEAPVIPGNAALDEFESMEGLSGSVHNDRLTGTRDVAADRQSLANGGASGFLGSVLDQQGINMVTGLQTLLGAGVTSFAAGDIIVGGAGSDVITGLEGDDRIDGDLMLNVRISIRQNADGTGPEIGTANSMKELTERVFNGQINPGQLVIVRELVAAGDTGEADVAVFSGNRADYDVTYGGGRTIVSHARGTQADGTDTLSNMEVLRFADGDVLNNPPATGSAVINDLTPTEGQQLTANAATIADGNGLGPLAHQWQSSPDGINWTNIAGATGLTFTPVDLAGMTFGPQAGLMLRVRTSFTDGAGNPEVVFSTPTTGPTGVNWVGNANANTFNGTAGDDIAGGAGAGDTLNGNAGADQLTGDGGQDTISGGDGDDVMTGGGANDTVNGGLGLDTAVFSGVLADYNFQGGATLVVSHDRGTEADGNDSLTGVETLSFAGVNYAATLGTGGADTLNGGTGSQVIFAMGGADAINGGAGNDVLFGEGGNDAFTQNASDGGRDYADGGAGTDTYVLNGDTSNETFQLLSRAGAISAGLTVNHVNTEVVITRNGAVIAELNNIEDIALAGGGGNDVFSGSAGQDTVAFSGAIAEYTLQGGNTLTVSHDRGTTADGNALLTSVETLRFGGVNYGVVLGTGNADPLSGGAGNQVVFGQGGGDTINGNAGNDVLYGGGGDDTFNQDTSVAGRDFVDGGAGSDTYVLNGDNGNEAFQILTSAAAVSAGLTVNHHNTEIVITRNGAVIAELNNIEEITVNALNTTANDGNGVINTGTTAGDTVSVVGNFNTTSLNYNTITVNGSGGADVVDISALSSDHRLVFNAKDTNDSVVGDLRPQDVVTSLFGGASGSGSDFALGTGMVAAALQRLQDRPLESHPWEGIEFFEFNRPQALFSARMEQLFPDHADWMQDDQPSLHGRIFHDIMRPDGEFVF